MTQAVAQVGRRFNEHLREIGAILRWSWDHLKRWWVGEEFAHRRDASRRRRQKQKQKEILRRLRGVA